MRTPGSEVAMMSLRERSGSSTGVIPARARSGAASSKMRPLERASVIIDRPFVVNVCGATGPSRQVCRLSLHALDCGTKRGEPLLHFLVAAIEMVNAIDRGLALGDQPCNHEAGRSAQVGSHDGRCRQFGHAGDERGVA